MRSYPRILVVAVCLLGSALLSSCGSTRDRTIPIAVTVAVDYGPVDRPSEEFSLMVKQRSSPADALAQVKPILQGYVCCTKEDVWSVDGVATDYEQSMYWVWRLNGLPQELAPDRYLLVNGDRVTWVYEQTERPEHRRRR